MSFSPGRESSALPMTLNNFHSTCQRGKFLFRSVTTINPSGGRCGEESVKMYINHLIRDECDSLVENGGSHVECKKHQVALSDFHPRTVNTTKARLSNNESFLDEPSLHD